MLGPVPPPFGGISVHVSRLVPLLADAGFRVGVLNHFDSADMPFVVGTLKRNPIRYYFLPKRHSAGIVHYHHARWPHLLAVALGKGNSSGHYIVTLHAGDIGRHFPQLTSKVPLVSRITVWALRRFDKIVLVNPDIAAAIGTYVDRERIEVVPAFLDLADRSFQYDASVEEFLNSGRTLAVAAYSVQFRPDGGELYGLDTAVEAFAELAPTRDDLRLALFIARRPGRFDLRARRHLRKLERRLEEVEVRHRAIILFGQPLAPALRGNAVFVRPTRAEGDAVSVREARGAGLRVVASNVVRRPSGVVSFATGDTHALVGALRTVLSGAGEIAEMPGTRETAEDSAVFSVPLIRLYREALDVSSDERRK